MTPHRRRYWFAVYPVGAVLEILQFEIEADAKECVLGLSGEAEAPLGLVIRTTSRTAAAQEAVKLVPRWATFETRDRSNRTLWDRHGARVGKGGQA